MAKAPDGATGYVPLPIRDDWLSLVSEPAIDPGLSIVDAHHHLWARPGSRYMAEEYAAECTAGHLLSASVHVECGYGADLAGPLHLRPVGETRFAERVRTEAHAGRYGDGHLCAALVARADLTQGDATAAALEAHATASAALRGIRQFAAWHPDPRVVSGFTAAPRGLLSDPAFRAGFARLAPAGLSFDAWIYHTQIEELADLSRSYSETAIVLNHFGGPVGTGPFSGRLGESFADWRRCLATLRDLPNVRVKLGGLGMRLGGFDLFARDRPPGSDELARLWAPIVETAIETVGPARAMFESNFPVDKGSVGWTVLWNTFKKITASFSADERARLFAGTATEVYRLWAEAS
ncbi:hypothetical protein GCM10011534_42900 [Pseudooceanicola nanhaiensis]|jgi:predicted TIM-barrel fold metal-dependent hydrolase|uniref:Amidohydrolase-related domain-containing protein n=1 Tax=Pseudooceanicola nanhaiensis TaxID=375761 RepID=A0A917TB12_9RHOB|nr:amidohydrolase family protein [Pseudooceanicola nanhaiensis]GGM16409.1 hypothetical protein GCM10011534_42900 [Pseudooceanicola nanhaiensis]